MLGGELAIAAISSKVQRKRERARQKKNFALETSAQLADNNAAQAVSSTSGSMAEMKNQATADKYTRQAAQLRSLQE